MPLGASRAGLMSTRVDAIPDLDLDHLWWGPSISDISTYPDEDGSLDLSSNGDPQLGQINDRQAAVYDGTDDSHTANQAVSLGESDVWTAAAVFEPIDNNDEGRVFVSGTDGSSLGGFGFGPDFGGDRYRVAHEGVGSVFGGTPTTDPQVFVATYDGSTVIADLNGSEIINESIADPDPLQEKTAIGESGAGSIFFEGSVGAVGTDAAAADATRRDELTNKLADQFDITVST